MDMLGCDHLSVLPPEVLSEIFFSLPSQVILLNIKLVCKAWNGIVNQTRFWFQRLKYLGFPLCIDVRSELLNLSNDEELLQCLKETCYYIESSLQQKTQHLLGTLPRVNIVRDWEDDGKWCITEDKLRVAAIMLCFRTPLLIEIVLYSNSDFLKQSTLFVNKLSIVDCEVYVKDLGSWRQLRESSVYKLIHKLTTFSTLFSTFEMRAMLTAVNTTDLLPTTIEKLYLGLLVDPATGAVRDPGLAHLTQRCPRLNWLGVHVKAGMVTEHLPCLPDVIWTDNGEEMPSTSLYLSHLSEDCHLQWAVDTARTLQPSRGYYHLVLPSCSLNVEQLCQLVGQLAAAGVTVDCSITISSPYNPQEEQMLWKATLLAFPCFLNWYENDDELTYDEDSPGW